MNNMYNLSDNSLVDDVHIIPVTRIGRGRLPPSLKVVEEKRLTLTDESDDSYQEVGGVNSPCEGMGSLNVLFLEDVAVGVPTRRM